MTNMTMLHQPPPIAQKTPFHPVIAGQDHVLGQDHVPGRDLVLGRDHVLGRDLVLLRDPVQDPVQDRDLVLHQDRVIVVGVGVGGEVVEAMIQAMKAMIQRRSI